MSDSCKVTARVTVLFPADLWFSSRERSPYVALDFEDFVHRVVFIHAPLGHLHLLEVSPKWPTILQQDSTASV